MGRGEYCRCALRMEKVKIKEKNKEKKKVILFDRRRLTAVIVKELRPIILWSAYPELAGDVDPRNTGCQ